MSLGLIHRRSTGARELRMLVKLVVTRKRESDELTCANRGIPSVELL